MRKTHERAAMNLMAGKQGRISARDRIEGGEWYYHGSPIVKVAADGVRPKVYVNWHGWYTPSTRDRLYALCAYLGVPRPEKKEGWIRVA